VLAKAWAPELFAGGRIGGATAGLRGAGIFALNHRAVDSRQRGGCNGKQGALSMAGYRLILGNKTYSSWSLRGWLAARLAGIAFEEVVILLHKPDTRANILKHSPGGKVPALVVDGEVIWDSLAIAEYLAECHPDRGLWPADPAARRLARCVTAEMHAGFVPLRRALPMDLSKRPPKQPLAPEVQADIDRIQQIWRDCRRRFGQGGDFLFGKPSIADAFYAPVVTRFRSYDVTLDAVAEAYCRAVTAWPLMQEWAAAAAEETEVLVFD
jgi:glutathione S-transferase